MVDNLYIMLYFAISLLLPVLGSHWLDRLIAFDFKRIILTLSVEWSKWLACPHTPRVLDLGFVQCSEAYLPGPCVDQRGNPIGRFFASATATCTRSFLHRVQVNRRPRGRPKFALDCTQIFLGIRLCITLLSSLRTWCEIRIRVWLAHKCAPTTSEKARTKQTLFIYSNFRCFWLQLNWNK